MSRTSSYDTANRIRNTGYGYDDLGRTLTTPAADTAPGAAGPLAATYYANDMVKSLTQTVDDAAGGTIAKETSYGLDPTGRIDTITNTTELAFRTSRSAFGSPALSVFDGFDGEGLEFGDEVA
jgi:hypothetical protein